jgi:hypothetical protein
LHNKPKAAVRAGAKMRTGPREKKKKKKKKKKRVTLY